MTAAVLASLTLATVAAYLLARRDAGHRPIRIYLVAVLLGALMQLPMWYGRERLGWVGPYAGWHRVVFHASQAGFLIDSAAIAWLAWTALAAEAVPLAWPLLGWLVAAGMLARAYPRLRGDSLRLALTGIELASLLVATLAIVSWLRRGGPVARLRASTLTERVTLCLIGASFLLLFLGAWPRGLWGDAWRPQQAGLVALYGGLAIVQAAAWWRAGRNA